MATARLNSVVMVNRKSHQDTHQPLVAQEEYLPKAGKNDLVLPQDTINTGDSSI